MPYPGEVLGGTYQIVDEIGKGGAGIIYRAYHLNLQKYVVVKKIKDNFVGVLNARGEVDILKSLHHSCLPQVYDFIQIGNEVYTVMDYIEGYDLKYYIDQGCHFEEEMLWRWLTQLCEVLDYLHKHGILHLDIKPANIMLNQEGNLFLIDFNISLSGEGNTITGISEIYASPEQYAKYWGVLYQTRGRDILLDARTDIYSLGASFYHMMTGYPPSPTEMYSIMEFNLPYSKNLVQIIAHMMERNRNRRFSSAERVLTAVKRIQRTKAEKYTLRAVFVLMLAAILTLGIVSGVVIYRGRWHVSKEERQMVQQEEIQLSEWNEEGEFQKAYQEGITFLNTEADLLDKIDGARQSILEKLLESCIGLEDYDSAKQYVEELLGMAEKPEYYQDAAIIAAYQGDFVSAQQYIQKAEEQGGSERELKKSRAELYAAQEEYDKAIAAYKEICQGSSDIEILRKIAILNLKAGTDSSLTEIEASAYLSEAVSCYGQIEDSGFSTYADRRNLVTAYVKCGMTEKAISMLQGMCINYPEQYEVFRELAILLYNSEMKKTPSDRDFTKVKEYAGEAERLFEMLQTDTKDEQLQNLLDIVEMLP